MLGIWTENVETLEQLITRNDTTILVATLTVLLIVFVVSVTKLKQLWTSKNTEVDTTYFPQLRPRVTLFASVLCFWLLVDPYYRSMEDLSNYTIVVAMLFAIALWRFVAVIIYLANHK